MIKVRVGDYYHHGFSAAVYIYDEERKRVDRLIGTVSDLATKGHPQ